MHTRRSAENWYSKISIHITGDILKSRDIKLQLRIRVLKCYVWSTLLYRSKTWTLTSDLMKQLEATEMWFLHRMLWMSYKDMVTNEEVLRRTNVDRTLIKDIVKRQMEFFGHVIRKEELENFVVTGFIEGKRARVRQRQIYLTYLPIELIHLAYERDVWLQLSK